MSYVPRHSWRGERKLMAARVEEAYSERDQTVNAKGEVTEIEIPYLVFGAEDEDAALLMMLGMMFCLISLLSWSAFAQAAICMWVSMDTSSPSNTKATKARCRTSCEVLCW